MKKKDCNVDYLEGLQSEKVVLNNKILTMPVIWFSINRKAHGEGKDQQTNYQI